jgi:conjugal transfer pilus assembly protein TraB
MAEEKPGPAGRLESPADVKRKQTFFLAVVVIAVLVAAFFTTIFTESATDNGAPRKRDAVSRTNIATPGSSVDARDVWIGTAGNQIATLEKEKQALEDRIRRLEERSASAEKRPNVPEFPQGGVPALPPMPAIPAMPPLPPVPQAPTADLPRGLQASPAGGNPQPGPALLPPRSAIVTTPVSAAISAPASPASASSGESAQGGTSKSRASVSPSTAPTGAVPAVPAAAGGATPERDLTREDYVPAGSFFRAVLLSGLDAPTGGQVQANPHPVLLRLTDNAVLPNLYRAQMKECFIVAAGYGDMSSERAYLRTEALSCVNQKGQVIDVPISGWAIGDDGKAGVRGRVVSKQGQALANAIVSGMLSGIGSAIRESAVNTQPTGGIFGGVTQTPKPGEEFKAGLGGGISKGLDRLTEYYVRLAERMFPVIEVDAGRVVDIALNKGMSLKGLFKHEQISAENVDDYPALKNRQRLLQNMSRELEVR